MKCLCSENCIPTNNSYDQIFKTIKTCARSVMFLPLTNLARRPSLHHSMAPRFTSTFETVEDAKFSFDEFNSMHSFTPVIYDRVQFLSGSS